MKAFEILKRRVELDTMAFQNGPDTTKSGGHLLTIFNW
jgi:hypothetical protein